jgi:integrase
VRPTLQETDLARGATWIKGKGRREKELGHRSSRRCASTCATAGRLPDRCFRLEALRGRHRDGQLETRSVLRIVRKLGQRVGLHVWPHALRHTSITQAAELGQRAGFGLDEIRAFSRHRSIVTLMMYVDEHDRERTQRSLSDLVARSVLSAASEGGRA